MSGSCAALIEPAAGGGWSRRDWLGLLLASGLVPGACHADALQTPPPSVSGFDATSLDGALKALGGAPAPADGVLLQMADVIENGAYAAARVVSAVPGTSEIALIVERNPNPMIVRFTIPPGTEPAVSLRIKLAQSGPVWAVVRARGQLFCAARNATVTTGACAG